MTTQGAFKVGDGNQVLAQISDAAAELLLEAHIVGERLGVELGGLFDKGTARELVAEGFGAMYLECETHGIVNVPCDMDCEADAYRVFVINDAGEGWLEDAGRI